MEDVKGYAACRVEGRRCGMQSRGDGRRRRRRDRGMTERQVKRLERLQWLTGDGRMACTVVGCSEVLR